MSETVSSVGTGVGVETSVAEPLTEKEQQQLTQLLSNPLFFPMAFQNWISQLVRGDVTKQLPFAQILRSDVLKGGVEQFANVSPGYAEWHVWKPAGTINVPGPCSAVVFFSGSSYNWSGDNGMIGISANDGPVSDSQVIWLRGAARRVFGSRAQYVDLPNDVNTVKLMVQRWGSGDVDFQDLTVAVFRIFLVS